MKPTPALAAFVAASTATLAAASPAPVPQDLAALAAKARIEARISAWCPLEFGRGRRGGYAVAVPSPTGGGRYLVLRPDSRAVELALFTGAADLSCYTPAQARRLDRALRASETLQGHIKPAGRSTVVCGFVAQTSARCWQHSPAVRAFVEVGYWLT